MLARLLLSSCLAVQAQTFEASSIKPATPLGPLGQRADQNGGPGTPDPGIFTCKNCSLHWILADAFKIHGYDFAGPDWLDSARFDFSAKIAAGASKEQFQAMLQNLLAERFKLAVHRENRSMQVYELTVAKNGPKFQEGKPKDDSGDAALSGKLQRDADGFPVLSGGMTMAIAGGHARLRSNNQTMAWFVEMLSSQVQSPVIDATGLKGTYDFVVSWAFGDSGAGVSPAPVETPASALITAVQSQLGLRMERKKEPSEVLVVDHIEKTPTGN